MNVPHKDSPLKGILFALAAAVMLSSMNMFGKLLGTLHGPVEITFYRNIIALVLLIGVLFFIKKLYLLRTKRPLAHFIRSFVGTVGMLFSMWTVILMPLTTATAFLFTAPLFVTLLSYPLLKERVGIFRLCAVIVGFSGVLLIARPENDITTFELSVGLIAGFLNGLVAICLRWLGNTESTATTNFYFMFFGFIGTALAMPFIATPPTIESSPWILGLGVVGLLSLLLKTQGFRLGPAALISPISYTMIIWALLFDFVIWRSIPQWTTLVGVAIIILSNLFIIYREHKKNNA